MPELYHGVQTSAKPAFIVDAYLFGGTLGILICLFSYGTLRQFIANKAEKLFGGYTLGTALILQVCSRYSGADNALSFVQFDMLELG